MKPTTDIGKNRTGIAVSPVDAADVIEQARKATPSRETNGEALEAMRLEYDEDAGPLGTVPPPASLKGAVKTVGRVIKGENPAVLIDKLAERLAFERTGVRLYDGIIHKRRAEPDDGVEPTVAQLEEIRADELAHFALVRDCIEKLGGDPTVQTPSADIVGVASTGILKVIRDSRTNLTQALEATLIAELTDNAGWELLIDVASDDAMKEQFRDALVAEQRHLANVRRWVEARVLGEAKKAAAPLTSELPH